MSTVKALALALTYIERGISPLPLPYKEKGCVIEGWPHLVITSETAPQYFNGARQNVGGLWGPSSSGAVDVDLDHPLARALAPYFLPKTGMCWGRKSNPESHWAYRCKGGWETKRYDDPDTPKGEKARIVELLGEGTQSVLPGSVHPTGERYDWAEGGDGEPSEIEHKELRLRIDRLMAAYLVAKRWDEGAHNDLNVRVAGTLLRGGWKAKRVENFIRIVATVREDPKIEERVERVAKLADSWSNPKRTKAVPGRKKLEDSLGGPATRLFCELMGVNDTGPERSARITYQAGGIAEAVDETLGVLIEKAHELRVYGRGERLVRPYIVLRDGPGSVKVPVLELEAISLTSLRVDLSRAIEFQVERPVKSGHSVTARADCPSDIARAIAEAPSRLARLPQLERVSQVPLFDGKQLVSIAGLHGSTWVECPQDVRLPGRLDKATAEQARDRVLSYLNEFPFVDDDQDRALALMLTAALRSSLPTAPGFMVTKPDHGAGATTLACLAGIISTGQLPPVMPFENGEEFRKQLASALMGGRHVLLPDNIPDGTEVTSALLAQVLSERSAWLRVLGTTEERFADFCRLVMMTGVGITPGADLVRRVIVIRIDPKIEHPALRSFKRPTLLADVRAARSTILSDLFTLCAAYLASGAGDRGSRLVGYEEWLKWVASPLIWLGHSDPVESVKESGAQDTKTQLLAQVLLLLAQLQQEAPFRQRGGFIVKDFASTIPPEGIANPETVRLWANMRSLLGDATDARVTDTAVLLNAERVGWWLKSVAGRVVGEMRLVRGGLDSRAKAALWRVEGGAPPPLPPHTPM